MSIYLSGPQIKSFVSALASAYTPLRFDQLLLGRLNKVRFNITMQPDYISILYDVVDLSNREGWALRMLAAARASNPENAQLIVLEESLGLGVISIDQKTSLEKIVKDRSTFVDVMRFRERLGRLENWVCAIETSVGGGTGLLIAPDAVLTNYHVIEPFVKGQASPTDARCRFDYKALPGGAAVNSGIAVPLAPNWDIQKSRYSAADLEAQGTGWTADELDFALVRLADAVGEQPIGAKAEIAAPNRGWLPITSKTPDLAQGDVMFILQHPQDLQVLPAKLQPMQLAAGNVLDFVGNGLRVRHDVRTLPGSSGSPCFNSGLELVSLHHAGEPNNRLDYKGAYNQAIPLKEIVRYLKEQGVSGILDRQP